MEVTPEGMVMADMMLLSLKEGTSVMPFGKITRNVLLDPVKNASGKAVKPCRNSIEVKDVGIFDELET